MPSGRIGIDRMHEPRSTGFPAVCHPTAERLILGSLPGQRSLLESQYYAQPQNAFWRIMGDLFDAGPEQAYSRRLERLVANRIALWDVVKSGSRPGSLDASIVRATVVVNDFDEFFAAHPRIGLILFNGRAAADLYRTKVKRRLSAAHSGIESVVLPSTSPAHAALSYAQKLDAWARILSTPA
jgi:TDG/mug DNA glycosylase family protein